MRVEFREHCDFLVPSENTRAVVAVWVFGALCKDPPQGKGGLNSTGTNLTLSRKAAGWARTQRLPGRERERENPKREKRGREGEFKKSVRESKGDREPIVSKRLPGSQKRERERER